LGLIWGGRDSKTWGYTLGIDVITQAPKERQQIAGDLEMVFVQEVGLLL
jgi:hypothetical protein